MGDPITDPANTQPPNAIMKRRLVVRPNVVNTVRLMHDRHDADSARWFIGSKPVRRGNDVRYLVRGKETFDAMGAALATATAAAEFTPQRFVYIAAWMLNLDIPMGSQSLRKWLTNIAAAGVEVRTLLWANSKGFGDPLNMWETRFINSLGSGRGILDAKTGILLKAWVLASNVWVVRSGSHHQKLFFVNGSEGLIAFCGGVDPNPDRLDYGTNHGFQDVHCRIQGPAAGDLLQIFEERWKDYLNGTDNDPTHDSFKPEGSARRDYLSSKTDKNLPPGAVYGNQLVQIGKTCPKDYYGFAMKGEQSVRQIILKAIGAARQYIYMEDQYLVNLDCADALADATKKDTFRALVIVIPDDGAVDQEQFNLAAYHRADFLKRLRSRGAPEKIHVFAANRYVHSKIYIMDDRLAIIGSANCNRRGWESDSEVVAAIFDESDDTKPTYRFAHRLRIRLWADHLNLARASGMPIVPQNTDDEYAELCDPIAAVAHWVKPIVAEVDPARRFRQHKVTLQGKNKEDAFATALHALMGDKPADQWFAKTTHVVERLTAQYAMSGGKLTADNVWNLIIDPPSPL